MSLAVESEYLLDEHRAGFAVALGNLSPGDRVRSSGMDDAHVRVLMETADRWPPILVWGDDCLVVDGAHRVEAARRLGHTSIRASRFQGSRDDAFVESVRRNVDHGLPLTAADRRRAALRVLTRHVEWSDRRIASLCGLSGKTVARLRDKGAGSNGDSVVIDLERRVGRDGKARPVQSGEIRERIRKALEQNPTGSLRTIAAMAGASPETVRTVRCRLAAHQSAGLVRRSTLVPPASHSDGPETSVAAATPDRGKVDTWVADPAITGSEAGTDFANWFTSNQVGDEWHNFIWAIPLGRLYDVVDEARRRAMIWTSFASVLESRTR